MREVPSSNFTHMRGHLFPTNRAKILFSTQSEGDIYKLTFGIIGIAIILREVVFRHTAISCQKLTEVSCV